MLLILTILLIFSSFELSETNQIPVGIESCKFYEEAESRFKCGPNGFLMNLGIKYCNSTFDPSKI